MSQRTATTTAAPQLVLPKSTTTSYVRDEKVDDNDNDVLDDKPKRWYVDVTDSAAETHRAMLGQWMFVFVVLVGYMCWYLGNEMTRMLPDWI